MTSKFKKRGDLRLEEHVRDKIQRWGPIPFATFMQLCLYHETQGFYRKKQVLGKKGHFFTSVQVSHLYGQLLAQQLKEMWEVMGQPCPFYLIEQGAHEGQLAIDILRWCRDFAPSFFETIRYEIIEPWAEGQYWQREKMAETNLDSKLGQKNLLEQLMNQLIEGVFLSQELVDAFPVHRIVFRQGEWKEIYVDWEQEFVERYCSIRDAELLKEIQSLPLPEVENYQTEVSLQAGRWMRELAQTLGRGFILIIDYGFSQEEYYAPHRSCGTLRTYHQHQTGKNFYKALGEQDITAHVNFSALKYVGESEGLYEVGYTDQTHFLTGIVKEDLLTLEKNPNHVPWMKAFQTLTHPSLMGSQFKVLCLSKNLPKLSLRGFQWQRKLL